MMMSLEDPAKTFPYQFHTSVDPRQQDSFTRIISYLQAPAPRSQRVLVSRQLLQCM